MCKVPFIAMYSEDPSIHSYLLNTVKSQLMSALNKFWLKSLIWKPSMCTHLLMRLLCIILQLSNIHWFCMIVDCFIWCDSASLTKWYPVLWEEEEFKNADNKRVWTGKLSSRMRVEMSYERAANYLSSTFNIVELTNWDSTSIIVFHLFIVCCLFVCTVIVYHGNWVCRYVVIHKSIGQIKILTWWCWMES